MRQKVGKADLANDHSEQRGMRILTSNYDAVSEALASIDATVYLRGPGIAGVPAEELTIVEF